MGMEKEICFWEEEDILEVLLKSLKFSKTKGALLE